MAKGIDLAACTGTVGLANMEQKALTEVIDRLNGEYGFCYAMLRHKPEVPTFRQALEEMLTARQALERAMALLAEIA